jgi:hypothetical protein
MLRGTKNQFHHKNWYVVRFVRVISNYVSKASTKIMDLANGCGINSKGRHYQNCLTWVTLLAKIHCQSVVTVVSFKSSLFQRLHQILDYLLELKICNNLGSNTGYNSFFLLKNISFSRGPNMAHEGSTLVVTTNRSIKWILVLVRIFGSPFSMLILISCYSTIWKVAMHFWSIMWNYPPWLIEGTSPPSHCNISFICFFILLINTIVIFHKQKWSTCIIIF